MPDRIGPCSIQRELGRGGMGVVFLATDTRLDRDVAIKALPEDLAADPTRLERFEREAKILAQLNHPNFAGIHGVEEADGHKYLVLEYVEGATLADMLERGPLPVHDAVEYAVQIAAGVEAAHEAGVIHRDLKPGNIIITPDGQAKVLDFGLARTDDGHASSSSFADAETVRQSSPAQHSPTIEGAILGTAAYMSPEQARGRRVDKRTDIWSFGVVLYEMLIGASPFVGETVSDSIGAVLHKNLDLDRLPPQTPVNVQRVLRRCLERDKNQRYRDIGDVRIELLRADEFDEATPVAAGRSRSVPMLLVMLLAIVVTAALVGTGVWFLKPGAGDSSPPTPTQTGPTLELTIPMPKGYEVSGPIAISRDGKRIAFAAQDDMEESRLFIRELDRFEFIEIPQSRDGRGPVFSPDGRSVVFFKRDGLYRASVDGGQPTPVARASGNTGTCVLEDGSIVYSTGVDSPLWRIPAGGGTAVALTNLAAIPGAYAHVWPQQIPGTNKILLTLWDDGDLAGGHITDTETGTVRPIIKNASPDSGVPMRWVASGHLILEAWGTLIAVPFDPESGGKFDNFERNQVLTSVSHLGNATRCVFDVSDDGTLAYVPAEPANPRLVWVDADGTVEIVLDNDISSGFRMGGNVEISPDGTRAVIGGGGDIAVVDLARGIPRRITFDQGNNLFPIWSPDGSRVLFNSNREDRWAVWSVAATGLGQPELVYKGENSTWVESISPDGRLCIHERTSDAGVNIWIIEPDGEARALVHTSYNEHAGTFSTDGRWVAFESDISGRDEIYVIQAAGDGQPIQITAGGGGEPKWGPLGKALYYRVGRSIMRVRMKDGRPAGEPERVFEGPTLNGGATYCLSPDETRVLAVEFAEEAIRDEIRIITNFFDRIREVAGPGSRQQPD
jgi:serine/threonine-protein kinase